MSVWVKPSRKIQPRIIIVLEANSYAKVEMCKSRFTETQIIGMMKTIEAGRLVKDIEEENHIHRRLHFARFITFDFKHVYLF